MDLTRFYRAYPVPWGCIEVEFIEYVVNPEILKIGVHTHSENTTIFSWGLILLRCCGGVQ